MSEFINIEFIQGEGLFFEAFIADEDRKFFLDLSLLEYITREKLIDNRAVAEMMFYSIRTRIHRACTLVQEENPNWPADIPLNLTRAHIL
jgi:hypothetical protein